MSNFSQPPYINIKKPPVFAPGSSYDQVTLLLMELYSDDRLIDDARFKPC